MHILHIALGGCLRAPPVSYGLTPDTGGHIAYVLEAARAQACQPGVEHVTILTRRFHDPALGSIHDTMHEPVTAKLSILRLGPGNNPYREKDAACLDVPDLTRRLLAYMKQRACRFDAIHAHFADAAQLALGVRAVVPVPVFYTPHAFGLDKLLCGAPRNAALYRRIARERHALTHADGVIVSTRDEAECQIPRYDSPDVTTRLRLIAPGAPTLDPAPASHGARFLAPLLAKPGKPLILAIARPVEKKNLLHLARCYARSPQLRARANLVILAGQHIGLREGSEEARVISGLCDLRRTYGMEDCMALPPAHDNADVAGLYRYAARSKGVFVNPALHEPFGLTLLEAAAVGLPVIATDRGGPVDILAGTGHGLTVSPDDAPALTEALSQILGSPRLWHGFSRAARERAGLFGWQSYGAESLAFYRSRSPVSGRTVTGARSSTDPLPMRSYSDPAPRPPSGTLPSDVTGSRLCLPAIVGAEIGA